MAWQTTQCGCGLVATVLDQILAAAQAAPGPLRSQIIQLVAKCMLHPPAGTMGMPPQPYTQADHCHDVCAALTAAQNQDWEACIGELEHLGNTGDVGIPVEVLIESLGKLMRLQRIPLEIIRDLLEEKFPVRRRGPKTGPRAKR